MCQDGNADRALNRNCPPDPEIDLVYLGLVDTTALTHGIRTYLSIGAASRRAENHRLDGRIRAMVANGLASLRLFCAELLWLWCKTRSCALTYLVNESGNLDNVRWYDMAAPPEAVVFNPPMI